MPAIIFTLCYKQASCIAIATLSKNKKYCHYHFIVLKFFQGDNMKIFKHKAFKIILAVVIASALLYGGFYLSVPIAGLCYIDNNIEYQNAHLKQLKNEFYVNYTPCDEQQFADFDIQQAYADGVKFNEVAFLGTHNSYQLLATGPKRAYDKFLHTVTSGDKGDKLGFEMDTLTTQFENGIRNIEIDIETVDDGETVSFIVTHDPIMDNVSSCYDFTKALEEVKLWSDNNPNHLPITIIIEPKGDVTNINNMKNFSLEYANILGETVKSVLGETLLTPAQMMRDYASFEEMRMADDWLTLEETSGKVMVLLHDCDVTDDYIAQDETIKSLPLFPMLRFEDIDKSYTSFILDNDPEDAIENNPTSIDTYNIIVRTRADNYPDFSDTQYNSANICGSHIITTDYPPRTVRNDQHTYTFNGYTVKLLDK